MLNSRQPSTLSNDTKRNPKEHVKAVTLRNGKELSDPITKMKNNELKRVAKEEQRLEVWKPKENKVILERISFLNNLYSYVPLVSYL